MGVEGEKLVRGWCGWCVLDELAGGKRGRRDDGGSADELGGRVGFSVAPLFKSAESIQQTNSAPRKERIRQVVLRNQCMPGRGGVNVSISVTHGQIERVALMLTVTCSSKVPGTEGS